MLIISSFTCRERCELFPGVAVETLTDKALLSFIFLLTHKPRQSCPKGQRAYVLPYILGSLSCIFRGLETFSEVEFVFINQLLKNYRQKTQPA